MSVRDTIVLNRSDLKYLLIDSLRAYSNNVVFIDGKNPYRFSINKKEFFVLIKNVHESGENRTNHDECRIQISKSSNFDIALSSATDLVVLGYFADIRVFTAWNPYLLKSRFNSRSTISVYSRFSVQERALTQGIAAYVDNNDQKVISFKPEYLGLYLENIKKIHRLNEQDLVSLIKESDELSGEDKDGSFEAEGEKLTITHTRYVRDPKFRKNVYQAYKHRCAMCGIQLELVEAAHIIPHSHEKGTDEIGNGICLCALHHTAYDRSLIYFDESLNIKINDKKIDYLKKLVWTLGYILFQECNSIKYNYRKIRYITQTSQILI
ncbi:MAG: HNH endonuclease [Polynucleobacter sp.]|nr:HNH endonuclease [Polynucleobacter sp.]